MCQLVIERPVAARLIQPVCPFGLPGSLTFSHCPWLPSKGSTVRSPVSGVVAGTGPSRADLMVGCE